jgi:hypothetical protein
VPTRCPTCGADHGEPPFGFAAALPDPVAALLPAARATRAIVGDDNAALDDAAFFLRGALVIPLAGGRPAIAWRAWVELPRKDYKRALALWRSERRAAEPPVAATLASALPGYRSTLGAPVTLRAAPAGQPLTIEVAAGHPLGAEQRAGVDRARLAALVAGALHG